MEPLARSVDTSEGVVVVPAFTGLGQPPLGPRRPGNHRRAQPRHRVGPTWPGPWSRPWASRSATWSMPWRPRAPRATVLRVDGGASAMALLLQLVADQTRLPVVRPVSVETTAIGAATLAGLAEGVWGSLDDLAALWTEDREFVPSAPRVDESESAHRAWLRAPSTGPGNWVGDGLGPRGSPVRRPPEVSSSRQPWSASSAMIEIHCRSRFRSTGCVRPTTRTACRHGPWRCHGAGPRPIRSGGGLGPQGHRSTPATARGARPSGGRPSQLTRRPVPSTTAAKVAARLRHDPAGEVLQQPGRRRLLEQLGGHVEQLGVTVGHGPVHRPHRFDGHAVDLEDLVPQQVDQIVAGQADPQLVDHDAVRRAGGCRWRPRPRPPSRSGWPPPRVHPADRGAAP